MAAPPPVDARALIERLPEPMRSLAAAGELRHYRAGERIVEEGAPGDALYVLLSGKVRAYSSDEAEREITYCIDTAGDCFGEMALDGGPRSATVEALEASVCSFVTRITAFRRLAEDGALATELLMRVIRRAREATERARRLAQLDVYGRLRTLLEELCTAGDDGLKQLPEPMTHQALAARVGASREMISRLMKDLERGGYVRSEGRVIALLKPLPARW